MFYIENKATITTTEQKIRLKAETLCHVWVTRRNLIFKTALTIFKLWPELLFQSASVWEWNIFMSMQASVSSSLKALYPLQVHPSFKLWTHWKICFMTCFFYSILNWCFSWKLSIEVWYVNDRNCYRLFSARKPSLSSALSITTVSRPLKGCDHLLKTKHISFRRFFIRLNIYWRVHCKDKKCENLWPSDSGGMLTNRVLTLVLVMEKKEMLRSGWIRRGAGFWWAQTRAPGAINCRLMLRRRFAMIGTEMKENFYRGGRNRQLKILERHGSLVSINGVWITYHTLFFLSFNGIIKLFPWIFRRKCEKA